MLLGCIADDFTGATDLALTLVRGGMRTALVVGVPATDTLPDDADAVVVALKSRTVPAGEAVAQSLAAAEALRASGARQLFFKYCSTFDSTDAGNIGPVTDALMEAAGAAFALACPAFPATGRTVCHGHLFVGHALLSDSPMRDHPLTPMRDADLVRVLGRQSRRRVGLLPHSAVDAGAAAVTEAVAALRAAGVAIAIADALNETHLRTLGAAMADAPLVTGASGMALGLPANFRRAGLLGDTDATAAVRPAPGRAAILAGSCSAATRGQIARFRAAGLPALAVGPGDDPSSSATGAAATGAAAAGAAAWEAAQPAHTPVLIHSSADPEAVAAIQARLGRERAAAQVEALFADLARRLVAAGTTRLIVAGGETSGAVVEGLGVRSLRVGPEIAPGVPWMAVADGPPLALALKSGNFGAPGLFLDAWRVLE